jgi:uncharacterized protein TIGR03905
MLIHYRPVGVCARHFTIELQDGMIQDLKVEAGCHGNLQGISALVKGCPAEEIIPRLEGIRCGRRPTSCPDQIARALREALQQEK